MNNNMCNVNLLMSIDRMLLEYRRIPPRCAIWAQAIAEALGQPKLKPDQTCFHMELGKAIVDGKEQSISASIAVTSDTQAPEAWLFADDHAIVCPALGQNDDLPVRLQTTEGVVAFIKAARDAMLKPLTTESYDEPCGETTDQLELVD